MQLWKRPRSIQQAAMHSKSIRTSVHLAVHDGPAAEVAIWHIGCSQHVDQLGMGARTYSEDKPTGETASNRNTELKKKAVASQRAGTNPMLAI